MYLEPIAVVLQVASLTSEQWLVVIICSSMTAILGQACKLRSDLAPNQASVERQA
jgi:hypothetical protein